ncbi:MAG: hypothetical protein JWO78_194 [Micavibrio sp.]|nr:hypothetical protein [Micavibrio sp.]
MTKRKKKPQANLIKASEFATPERMRQDGGMTIEPVDDFRKNGEVIQVRQKAKQTCKLDWYLGAKTITKEMHDAGLRFAWLHFLAGKLPRTTAMYGDFITGRMGQEPTLASTDAKIALNKALAVMDGQEKDVVWDVCGNDLYAATVIRTRKLVTGLRALVTHFGIKL